jgi:hypothetical protein
LKNLQISPRSFCDLIFASGITRLEAFSINLFPL